MFDMNTVLVSYNLVKIQVILHRHVYMIFFSSTVIYIKISSLVIKIDRKGPTKQLKRRPKGSPWGLS